MASAFISKEADDGAQTGALLGQITDPMASVTGNGAYDQDAVCAAVAERHPDAAVIVPPRTTAVPSGMADIAPTQRDRHLQSIATNGRMAWQQATGYKVPLQSSTFSRIRNDKILGTQRAICCISGP